MSISFTYLHISMKPNLKSKINKFNLRERREKVVSYSYYHELPNYNLIPTPNRSSHLTSHAIRCMHAVLCHSGCSPKTRIQTPLQTIHAPKIHPSMYVCNPNLPKIQKVQQGVSCSVLSYVSISHAYYPCPSTAKPICALCLILRSSLNTDHKR